MILMLPAKAPGSTPRFVAGRRYEFLQPIRPDPFQLQAASIQNSQLVLWQDISLLGPNHMRKAHLLFVRLVAEAARCLAGDVEFWRSRRDRVRNLVGGRRVQPVSISLRGQDTKRCCSWLETGPKRWDWIIGSDGRPCAR